MFSSCGDGLLITGQPPNLGDNPTGPALDWLRQHGWQTHPDLLCPAHAHGSPTARSFAAGDSFLTDNPDIRARWFGVVVCATPRLGELGRGITIPWRVLAALITAQQPRGLP